MKKIYGFILLTVSILLVSSNAQAASDTEVLQPVAPAEATKIGDLGSYFDEYSSYMQLTTALHSDQTSWWPDIHIGGQGVGGVTFFNGTIVNSTTNPETGADQPVTFGDKVRIDDYIYRNAPGAADEMPVLIGDGLSPALDDANSLGETGRRWQYLYVSDNIYGANVIHEDNLSVTNSPTANYYLGYAGSNRFTWMKVSDHDGLSELESTVEDGEVVVRDGDSWTTNNVSEVINNSVTEGDTVIDDILSGLDCADGEIIIYDTTTSSWLCDSIDEAAGGIAAGVDGSDGTDGSDGADGADAITDGRIEQGRIQVLAAAITAVGTGCRTTGYENLGSASFETAYSDPDSVIITATYGAEPADAPDTAYFNQNPGVQPLVIVRTVVDETVTGFDAYGCPPEPGYIYWRAFGE